jgi:translocation and assembly module TamB
MARFRRTLAGVIAGAGLVAVLLIGAVLYLTRTEAGVERAGGYVVERLRGAVNGELEVARVRSRGLLRGVTLDGVRITGPDGRLFLQADSARLTYRIRTLLGGDIAFDRLTLYRPEIHVERLPGSDEWNFQTIFPEDPDRAADNIVLIEDVTIRDGYVAVRMPWEPPPGGGDTERLLLEDVPGGQVRTVRFEDLQGRLPRILWQEPGVEGRIIQIGQLSGRAYIWDTPAEIRQARGTVTLRDSIVTFRVGGVRLPESELSALGTIVISEAGNRYDIEAESDRVSFGDFHWLYPLLPDEGGGALRFRIQTRERGNTLWLVRDARLRTTGSEVSGSFGVVTGDTLYFTDVALRASPLDLELVQRLLPVELPVEGLLIGTVEVDGPLSSLRTRGDLRYRGHAGAGAGDGGAGSHVRWDGRVRSEEPFAVRGLDADVRSLDLGLVAVFLPALRVRGTASGRVRLDGSLAAGLRMDGGLALDQAGVRSALSGAGTVVAVDGRPSIDLQLDAEAIDLGIVADQFPGLTRLAGDLAGPVRLTGPLHDLQVEADLRTPAGAIRLNGQLDLADGERGYHGRGEVAGFRLDRFLDGIPETTVTGTFEAVGSHGSVETAVGRLAIDATDGRMAGAQIQRGTLRVRVADGVARVDTLTLSAAAADLAVTGTFGLAVGRQGTLEGVLRVTSLAPFEPLVFNGAPLDDLALGGPRLGGAVTVSGTLTGSRAAWSGRAEAHGQNVVYRGVELRGVTATVRHGPEGLAVEVTGDSVRAAGKLLPGLRATGRYAGRAGQVEVRARGLAEQTLEAQGAFTRLNGTVHVQLRHLVVGAGDAHWAIQDEVAARLGRHGIEVDSLVLRRLPGDASIRIAGVLPWRQPEATGPLSAALAIDAHRVPIGEVSRLIQGDTLVAGVLSANLRVTGTALDPVLDAGLVARPFHYGEAALDSVVGALRYRDRLLAGGLFGWLDGRAILATDATVPVELALTHLEDRLLDRPLHVAFRADDMPAGLLAFLIPGLRQVEGRVDGDIALVGLTTGFAGVARPLFEGELRLTGGSARVEPLNAHFHDMAATARFGEGSLVAIDASFRSEQGSAVARGSVDLGRLSDPDLDLAISARRFDASRRRDVTATVDGEVHLGGRYRRPVISGVVRLVAGEMNLDEVVRQYHIVQLDTTLVHLFDGATSSYRPGPSNPFLANLILRGLTVNAERGFWLRSRELNVEVAGSLDLAVDRQLSDIRLTGSMEALRGSYQLQVLERLPARRFEIREGAINFVGTPGIDPNLDIIASYRIRRAQGDPLDVVASLSGTLQSPRVRLSSESDPPVSETDIASFLLFGRSSLELSQAESDVVASMREGMLGLARPVVLSLASTQLQHAAASLGLPVDYLALTAPEYGFGDYSQVMSVHGGLGVLQGTQLEAGFYAHPDVFVLGTFAPFARGLGTFAQTDALFQPRFGARVEWRFRPTWTWEFYWEDRFARSPSFTYDQIHDRPEVGVSVFREWGY